MYKKQKVHPMRKEIKMNRRQFVTTVSAAAIAAIAPMPTLAKVSIAPGTETIGALDAVFQIMEDYGFDRLNEKAGLFSYYPDSFADFDELYDVVHRFAVEWNQRDHWDRVGFMLTIRQKLTKRFGDDLSAHIEWLDTPHCTFGDKTPRQMMSTLSYPDMYWVVKTLEQETAPAV
jgi:hypothetical protein